MGAMIVPPNGTRIPRTMLTVKTKKPGNRLTYPILRAFFTDVPSS